MVKGMIKAFPTHFGLIFYFTSSKSHFFKFNYPFLQNTTHSILYFTILHIKILLNKFFFFFHTPTIQPIYDNTTLPNPRQHQPPKPTGNTNLPHPHLPRTSPPVVANIITISPKPKLTATQTQPHRIQIATKPPAPTHPHPHPHSSRTTSPPATANIITISPKTKLTANPP